MNYRKITGKHVESRLYGNIGGWTANGEDFAGMLEELESKGFEELTIRLHCYGGSVFENNVIQNAMSRSKLKINVMIDGIAASMGFMFLTGTEPKNIQIAENGFGMIHRPTAYTEGDREEHASAVKLLGDIENNFVKTISERAGLSEEEVRSRWIDGNDHWLNANEMVQYGFVGKIMPAVAKNIKDLKIDEISTLPAENVYNRFAACLDSKENSIHLNNNKMKQLLIDTFNLKGITAESSDTAVLEAVKAVVQEKESEIIRLKNAAKAETDKAIEAVIAQAKNEGKIFATSGKTAEQVEAEMKKIGETAGLETLNVVLASLSGKKPHQSIVEMIANEGKYPAEANKDWEWYQKNDPKSLEKMAKDDKESFKAIYRAEFGSDPDVE